MHFSAAVLVVAAFTALLTVIALKGKYGMLVGGLVLRILWIVAAVRLAKPGSVWARTFYDQAAMDEAARRAGLDADHAPRSTLAARPPVPRTVTVAAVAVTVVAVAGLLHPGGALGGVAIVPAVLARRGGGGARIAALVLTWLDVAVAVAFVGAGVRGISLTALLVVAVLQAGAATVATVAGRRPEATEYFAAVRAVLDAR